MIYEHSGIGTFMEKAFYTERFLSRREAQDFLETIINKHLSEYPNQEVIEYRLVLIGGIYSAGVTFSTGQYEMDWGPDVGEERIYD